MATKRSSPGKKAKAAKSRSKPAARSNVELGPVLAIKVRVPINEKVYQKKESELAQLEVLIGKKKRAIMPTQNEIRQLRKQVAGLTVDIENNTEEREEKVRHEWHFNTNEVRIMRASDMKLLEKRTMTAEERKRNSDLEDARYQKASASVMNGTSPLTLVEEAGLAAAVAEQAEEGPAEHEENLE